MTETLITLPNREEMLARLVVVDNNPHLQERFYPRLLKEAGQEKVPMGVVMLLTLSIADYTQGMPPVMENIMNMRIPQFIDALVPDPQASKEAKDFFSEAMG
jgi:hypothetical protein